jgi:hypothetical protein
MLLSQLNLLSDELKNYPKAATSIIKIIYDICIENNIDLIILLLDGVIVLVPTYNSDKINLLPFRGSRRIASNVGKDILRIVEEADLPHLIKEDKKVFNQKVKSLKKELNSIIKSYIETRSNK